MVRLGPGPAAGSWPWSLTSRRCPCATAAPGVDRLLELFMSVHREDDADPFIGRHRLPELFARRA